MFIPHKMSLFLPGLVCAMLLAGCISHIMREPSPQEMATWDYGPFPENYREIVLASPALRTTDSVGARHEFQGSPQKKWANDGTGFIYGWAGTVRTFGNTTGTVTHEYFIRHGKLLRIIQENDQRRFRL